MIIMIIVTIIIPIIIITTIIKTMTMRRNHTISVSGLLSLWKAEIQKV